MTTKKTSHAKPLSPYWAEAFKPDADKLSEGVLAAARRRSFAYRGSGNPNARFTDEQRRAVAAEARQPGAKIRVIARKYGFSETYVSNIKLGKRGSV